MAEGSISNSYHSFFVPSLLHHPGRLSIPDLTVSGIKDTKAIFSVVMRNCRFFGLILVALITLGVLTPLRAAVFSGYAFDTEISVPTEPNLTFGAFERNGVTAATVAGIFNSAGWSTGSSIDLGLYVQFTVSPDTGYTLGLTSLTWTTTRTGGNPSGPTDAEVRIFANGDFNTVLDSYSWAPNPGNNTRTFTFITPVSSATSISFRYYGWNSGAPETVMSFDDVILDGTVAPVPEPSSTALLACGVALLLGIRRRPRN